MRTELLIIDPQKDFCSPKLSDGRPGALFVTGADSDAKRLAAMIQRLGDKIDDIHVTMDSHHRLDIAHPMMWQDKKGSNPKPFTIITEQDLTGGTWATTIPAFMSIAVNYVKQLAVNGRYPLCIWPEHCLIGTEGATVVEPVIKALHLWEGKNLGFVDFVIKGSNFLTEHYSAVQADVPDPTDPGTQLNTRLIRILEQADDILITGQALSHCVANTVTDIANNFGDESIKKFILLTDTASNVPGFEKMGLDFVSNMTKRGMRTATSTEVYK